MVGSVLNPSALSAKRRIISSRSTRWNVLTRRCEMQKHGPQQRRGIEGIEMGRSDMVGVRALRATMLGIVALVWALCWAGAASSLHAADLNSDLVETETGWQFGGDEVLIDTFDGPAPPPGAASLAPAPAVKSKVGSIPLINGDFESCNASGNATITQDSTSTSIVNWAVGGSGVQILFASTYGAPASTPSSKLCIHLNNPTATANGTQGSLSTTLATNPATGKFYTVQYDVCRAPDGPINLWPALRLSAIQSGTVHDWIIHMPVYNTSDTMGHSTWTRQSFVYVGTGAPTVIKIESMSEKYGPIIDNVATLTGVHQLASAPSIGKATGLCQRALSPFSISLVALALLHLL